MLVGKRILVAEDDPWIASALVDAIIDQSGVALGPAATNEQALALIETCPDGAIVDGHLLDGPSTAAIQALHASSVPLVMFTGLGLPPVLRNSHRDVAVLLKPAPFESVLAALTAQITAVKLRTERR
jgi:DNA-binding response OmpR family regulator